MEIIILIFVATFSFSSCTMFHLLMKNGKAFLLIFSGLLLLSSCSVDRISGDGAEVIPVWKTRLDDCINRPVTKAETTSLRLVKYSLRKKVNPLKDIDEIIDTIFDDDADIAVFDGKELVFTKVKTLKRPATVQELNNNDARFSFMMGNALVDLFYEYQGKMYRSVALVSDTEGVLYDNIGSRIIYEGRPFASARDVEPPIDTTGVEGQDTSSVVVKTFHKEREYSNSLGEWASFSMDCSSSFNSGGILIDRNFHCESHSSIFMKCQAQIATLHGELFVSNYHEFAWAYGFGTNITISLAPSGIGFTITGNLSEQESGTEIHQR